MQLSQLSTDQPRSQLVLTPSIETADRESERGRNAEALRTFKARLRGLFAPGSADEEAAAWVRSCVRAEDVPTSLRPKARVTWLAQRAADTRRVNVASEGSLAHLVRQCDPHALANLAGRTIVFRGFSWLSESDLALASALLHVLSRIGGDVSVEIPGAEQQRLDFSLADPFAPFADAVAVALQGPPTFVESDVPFGNLALAEAEGLVRRVRAVSEWEAAEVLVRGIDHFLQKKGAVLSDVGVVVSDLSSPAVGPALHALFRAGIPCMDPRGFSREEAHVIWAARRLVELAEVTTPRELAELLGSSSIDVGLSRKEAATLQKELRTTSLARVPSFATFLSEHEAFRDKPDLAETIRGLTSTRTRAECLEALTRAWDAFGLFRAADRGGSLHLRDDARLSPAAELELRAVAREGAFARRLLDAARSYEHALRAEEGGASTATCPLVLFEILELVSKHLPPLAASLAGTIRIVDLAEAHGLAASHLFVLDACDDDDGGHKRADLTYSGAKIWGLLNGRANVTFVAPAFRAGEAATPWPEIDHGEWQTEPGKHVPLSPSARARLELERERELYFLTPTRVATENIGKLPEGTILEAFAAPNGRSIPVTTLESFATCPFRGYAEHVLSAREKTTDALTLDARSEGALLHEWCAEVFERTKAEWAKRPRDAEKILDLVDSYAAARLAAEHPGSLRLVELRFASLVAKQVVLSAIFDETWNYEFAELSFGSPDSPWKALVLPRSGVRVTGRIDRVDVHFTGKERRVIDYKRGAQDERLVGVTSLQLPLYARVIEHETSARVSEGAYFRLLGKGTGPKAVRAAQWDNVLASSLSKADETFLLARSGRIEPKPYDTLLCEKCSVSGVCRKPPFAIPEAEELP